MNSKGKCIKKKKWNNINVKNVKRKRKEEQDAREVQRCRKWKMFY